MKGRGILASAAMVISTFAVLYGGEKPAPTAVPTHGRTYAIAGLPQHDYTFDLEYEHGTLTPLECAGTVGFIIRPNGRVDAARRWVWISNLFLAVKYDKHRDAAHRFYVEKLLEDGFHVVGVDVGTSCGSPAGAAIYDRFYRLLVDEHRLNKKARMIGQSNAGLITYGFAFRYPERVDRIFAIFPATDLRSWPGLHRLVDGVKFVPAGLSYGLSAEAWTKRLPEMNPIDNLKPLAAAGVKLFHVHGTADDIVPLEPNSGEFARRYRALGGEIELEIVEGGTHGSPAKAFFESPRAVEFLTE